jgi:membrane protease subunit HflK
LYIEAIESVYSNSNKVLLDAEGSGNLLYLPVDQLIQQRSGGDVVSGSGQSNSGGGGSVPAGSGTSPSNQGSRSRGSR